MGVWAHTEHMTKLRPRGRRGAAKASALAAIAAVVALGGCASRSAQASAGSRTAAPSSSAVSPAPRSASMARGFGAVHAQVSRQQPRLKAEGINIVTWGPNARQKREQLTVQDLTGRKAAILDSLFGRNNIILVTTKAATAGCGCAATPKSPAPTLPVPRTTH